MMSKFQNEINALKTNKTKKKKKKSKKKQIFTFFLLLVLRAISINYKFKKMKRKNISQRKSNFKDKCEKQNRFFKIFETKKKKKK